MGKTTLARKYLQQKFGSFLEFPIAKETKDIASIEGLIEEKLRQLGEEPGREFWVSLDRLKRKLQSDRIGILIDNLEPALDSAGKFIEAHRRYVELLRVLSDPTLQSITLITSRERLREADVTVQHYPLRSLDVSAWEQFFQSRNIQITPFSLAGRGVVGEGALAALHNAYGGNAKAMDIISGAVLEDFAGNVEAYWQANQDDLFIERDLEDLVTKQFDRLQQLDPDAYNLLCRMGCYRYQDVPTVPIEGLFCLLWDVPENRHRRVIKSLQDRSLIDFENGEFWLHPVIRIEAISRLRTSNDWEVANTKAAEFWTEKIKTITSIDDALLAFESYYHWTAINNLEKAGSVILQERICNLSDPERLGRSFYKLGIFQQLTSAIHLIIDKTSPSYAKSELYGLLGVSYQITGKIHQAIRFHEKGKNICIEFLNLANELDDSDIRKFKQKKVGALAAIGICKIELWELLDALDIFEKLYIDIDEMDSKAFIFIALAFLYSNFERKQKAFDFIEKACKRIRSRNRITTGYGLFFLGSTYKNLKMFEEAFEIYEQSVKYAEISYYPQVKARAVNGLAELYREQANFKFALEYHLEALDILEKIEAKNDIAQVYYQFGLTYQAMDELKRSQDSFHKAIQLFTEMEAPKQVERVRQSMQNSK
ncbi:MAG: tetratricopeptide repeat protein [Scytolyngbya sp. HA4215-MV1]|nr:tetratricopeptide repeat protein [Scytolyngbya sp. HA4215-MV1]